MKRILCIITQPVTEDMEDINELFSSADISSGYNAAVIVLHDDFYTEERFLYPCFVLKQDTFTKNITSPYKEIEYFDMLNMILVADSVICF